MVSNFLLENEFPRLATKICHVYCNIIKPYQFDNQHCQIIRSISLPRSNTYHFNSLKTQQYFRLNCNVLKSISIKLTNDITQNIPLLSGVPSIIKLNFKAMDKKALISNLKVSSNSNSFSTFVNTNSHFRTKIPSNLNFNQTNLKMCVSSITFPSNSKTLPSSTYNTGINIFDLNFLDLSIKSRKQIDIPKSTFETNNELLHALNQNIAKGKISNVSFQNTYGPLPGLKSKNGDYCMIKSNLYTIIALPLNLCILLGIRRDFITLDDTGNYKWSNPDRYQRIYVSLKI